MTLLHALLPPVKLEGDDGLVKASRMTHQEQLVAAGIGVINLVLSVGLSFEGASQVLAIALGVATTVAVLVAARYGNRLITAMAILACTLATQPGSKALGATVSFAAIIPFYGTAMWMVLKMNRITKEQAVLKRQQRTASGAGTGGGRGSVKDGQARPGPTRKPTAAKPPPSKRYTPPKAKKRTSAPKAKAPADD